MNTETYYTLADLDHHSFRVEVTGQKVSVFRHVGDEYEEFIEFTAMRTIPAPAYTYPPREHAEADNESEDESENESGDESDDDPEPNQITDAQQGEAERNGNAIVRLVRPSEIVGDSIDGIPTNNFIGNSVLVQLAPLLYVVISRDIKIVQTIKEIVSFVSPPMYPYGIDEDGNKYPFVEDCILLNRDRSNLNIPQNIRNDPDPYRLLYRLSLMTVDEGCIPPQNPIVANTDHIERFYIGNEQYTMTWHPDPQKDYARFLRDIGSPIEIRDTSGARREISSEEYVGINRRFGELIGAIRMIVLAEM